jgi:chromosome segregation ATPase
MPEIGARNLRRLAALETRLEKSRGERARLATERTELRRSVAAGEKALRSSEDQVSALVEENKRLADELAVATKDAEALRRAAQAAKEGITEARKQLRAAESARGKAEKRSVALERERDRLGDRLKIAEAQVKGKPAQIVSANEAAGLVGDLIDRLQSGLGAVAVREGELRLKVAFGKVGRTSGLVLPTPESAEELRGSLHDVAIKFDRSTLEAGGERETG